MKFNKENLVYTWEIVSYALFFVLIVYSSYIEFAEDLTKRESIRFFFIDLSPWSYMILGNILLMLISTIRRK